jgi:O-antigen ligase
MNQADHTANKPRFRTRFGPFAHQAQLVFVLLMLLTGFFSIAISQIALGLGLLCLLYLWFGEGRRPVRTGLERPAIALTVWALLMIPFSTDSPTSLLYFRRFYLLTAFWVAASAAGTERRRFLLLAAVGLGALGTSLYGHFEPLLAGKELFFTRFRGTFNPMTTGVLLMAIALVAFGFFAAARTRRRWQILFGVAFLSLTLGLAQTGTRSAILGLAGGLSLMFLVIRPRLFGALLVVSLLMVVLFRGPLTGLVPERLAKRFRISELQSSTSALARKEMYSGGWQIIKANPITGVGDRGMMEVAPQYYGDEETRYYGHLHSNPIHMAAIWGVPGFLLGTWFMLAPGWLLMKRWRILWRDRIGNRALPSVFGWVLGAIGAWMGFNLAGLTEWYFGDAESMLIYLGLLGCAFGTWPKTQSTTETDQERANA